MNHTIRIFSVVCIIVTTMTSLYSQKPLNKIIVQTDSSKYTINKNIYGHFAVSPL